MDLTIWMSIGFLLASYSVIANDSVQTLGTFIASNSEKINWKWLWLASSSVMIWTLWYGWYTYGGDISYGRLNRIPFQEIQWYHAIAPAILMLLTRVGIPVSTSFLVLSAFASGVVLEKMLVKSVIGYGLSAIVAFSLWIIISKYIDEKYDRVPESQKRYWRIGQWCTTGFLWWTWLSHDLANIAVFLPRQLSLTMLLIIMGIFVAGLGWMFYEKGGRIQKIVLDKTGTRYVRSATIIDFVYAIILLVFKEINDIPMSTTFCFLGLLAGREFAISLASGGNYKIKYVWPIVAKDFMKLTIGLLSSVAIILIIFETLK